MSENTIPDAVAADLHDQFLNSPPAGMSLPAERVRLRHETGDLPSPRLTILTADPRPVPRMDGTAVVPVSLEYITSMDRVPPEEHQLAARSLDKWFVDLRASKRRAVLKTRIYLHELKTLQPSTAIRTTEREQVTIIRGEITATLVEI